MATDWFVPFDPSDVGYAPAPTAFDWGQMSSPIPMTSPTPAPTDWMTSLSNTATQLAPVAQLGAMGFEAWQGYDQMQANQEYQRQLSDYNRQRAEAEAAYNAQVMDYLGRKAAWEEEAFGMWGEGMAGFEEGMGAFNEQMSAAMANADMVMNEYLTAARPLLLQAGELTEAGTAALARGEVPPEWQPIFDQARQRAEAAAYQSLASAGIPQGTAQAMVGPQIDQQLTAMTLQVGSTLFGQGLQGTQQGMAGLQGAGNAVGLQGDLATAALNPVMAEFDIMSRTLASLLGGGFPTLAPATGQPPRPIA